MKGQGQVNALPAARQTTPRPDHPGGIDVAPGGVDFGVAKLLGGVVFADRFEF